MKIGTTSWIRRFNRAVNANPQTSLVSFLAMRNVSWYSLFGIYSNMFSFGPELAVGYFVTKCTSKFRQPLNVAVAAVLLKAFPILKQVNSKALVGILSPTDIGLSKSVFVPPVSVIGAGEAKSSIDINPHMENMISKLHASIEYVVNGPVNTYGFSLFLASRITMASSVITVSACTYYGYDMTSFLASYGISKTIQSAGGAMAMSTLTNVILLPVQLYFLPSFIPKASTLTQKHDIQSMYQYVSYRAVRLLQFRSQDQQIFDNRVLSDGSKSSLMVTMEVEGDVNVKRRRTGGIIAETVISETKSERK